MSFYIKHFKALHTTSTENIFMSELTTVVCAAAEEVILGAEPSLLTVFLAALPPTLYIKYDQSQPKLLNI